MEKLEAFKQLVHERPFLIERVHSNQTTWQKLFEIYDLFGADHEVLKNQTTNSVKKETPDVINGALKMFQGLDMNKVNENLLGVKKVLGLFSELTSASDKKVETPKPRTPFRRFHD